jgi:hypothetical protein
MTDRELNDYYLKALYYAWGRQDGGAKVNAIEFAMCYMHNASEGRLISVQDCFAMFLKGERVFTRG